MTVPVPTLGQSLSLARGPEWKNRITLAPLTNRQSHADGTLSDEEFRWLTMRAQGGFSLTMTCASHVQPVGQGFGGQLGVFSDTHIPGLTRLAAAIRAAGSVSSIQLHHAGIRSDKEVVAHPVSASDDAESGARALTTAEVETLRDDFIAAARRAEQAGFDGVEVHGAHGYILTQFLSEETNRRTDRYGGSLENRARLLFEIIAGIRAACRPDFQVGLRLSTERYGINLMETRELVGQLLSAAEIDYLDLSLWDVFKLPADEAHGERTLLGWFTDLPRNGVRLGAAGKIASAADVQAVLDAGCDFAVIGTGAIIDHAFARHAIADPGFRPPSAPVSKEALIQQGVGQPFLDYLRERPGFIAAEEPA